MRAHEEDDDEEFSERAPSGKRRSLGDGDRSQEKRRKLDDVSHYSTFSQRIVSLLSTRLSKPPDYRENNVTHFTNLSLNIMGVGRGMVKVRLQQFTYLQPSLSAWTVICFGNLLIDLMVRFTNINYASGLRFLDSHFNIQPLEYPATLTTNTIQYTTTKFSA